MSFHEKLLDRKGRVKAKQPFKTDKPVFVQRGPDAAGRLIGKPASHRAKSEAVPFSEARFQKRIDPLSQPPFSVRSLAKRWCCSESVVRNEISANRLGHFRIGNLIRVTAAEVARFECQE